MIQNILTSELSKKKNRQLKKKKFKKPYGLCKIVSGLI